MNRREKEESVSYYTDREDEISNYDIYYISTVSIRGMASNDWRTLTASQFEIVDKPLARLRWFKTVSSTFQDLDFDVSL